MNYSEILTTVLSSIGIAGITSIIICGVKTISTASHTIALNKNTKAIESLKAEIVDAVKDSLQCSVDVDLSAKLNPMLEEIRSDYVLGKKNEVEQLYALKTLLVEEMSILSSSKKLDADKKATLDALIKKCEKLCPEAKAVPTLKLSLKEEKKEVVEEQVIEDVANVMQV